MIGKTLGKYKIVEKIGRGGMAEVYKAYHPGLDRHVAIKLMHNFLADEQGFLERFQREARSIARLSHSNIVHVYDFDVADDDTYYMVMEYLPGPALKNHLAELRARGEWLSLEQAVRIVRDVGEALDYAHNHGIFHRDVKPANIMMSQDRGAILTDFGIVKMLGSNTQLTASGAIVGTPAYMAPEQSLGASGDTRTDVYSLGIVLYQLTTGQLPYDADTPMAIILKHVSSPLPAPGLLNPDLPEGIERVIFKALAKDPDNRYQAVRDMLEHLEQAMMGLDIPEVDPAITTVSQTIEGVPTVIIQDSSASTQAAAAPKEPGRRPPLWIWGLIGLALIAVLIVFTVTGMGQGDEPTPTATLSHTPVSPATPTAEPLPTLRVEPQDKAAVQQPTDTVRATPATETPTGTPTPTSSPTMTMTSAATPEALGTVLQDGAELRRGANTWWYAHQTLPAGTQVELVGYDPGFPGWVYVRSLDGASIGWTQTTDLDTRREWDTLPPVTTVPTLTPTPAGSPVSTTPAGACAGGPLELDAWDTNRACTDSGWTATIFAEGRGGDCLYTYSWEGKVQGGPMPGSITFPVHSAGFGTAIVGKVLVTSGGETLEKEVYVAAPSCP